MPHRVVRTVGTKGVPFVFHIGNITKGSFVLASPENITSDLLLFTATSVCKDLRKGDCEVFVMAGPDKGDQLEGPALDIIEGLRLSLDKLGVSYRTMKRNTSITNIDIPDAVVFNLVLPT